MRRKLWAWLLRHVFAIDVKVCPQCAGPMKWREVALTAEAIRVGLARVGVMLRSYLPAPLHTSVRGSGDFDANEHGRAARSTAPCLDARERTIPHGGREAT